MVGILQSVASSNSFRSMDRDILCDPLLVRVEDMGYGLLLPPGSGWQVDGLPSHILTNFGWPFSRSHDLIKETEAKG